MGFGKLEAGPAVGSGQVRFGHRPGVMLAVQRQQGHALLTCLLCVMTPSQGHAASGNNAICVCKPPFCPRPLELWLGEADQQDFLGTFPHGFISLVLR